MHFFNDFQEHVINLIYFNLALLREEVSLISVVSLVGSFLIFSLKNQLATTHLVQQHIDYSDLVQMGNRNKLIHGLSNGTSVVELLTQVLF